MIHSTLKNTILLLVVVVCLSGASEVEASYDYYENFDGYADNSNVTDIPGWEGQTDWEVTNNFSLSAPHSVGCNASGCITTDSDIPRYTVPSTTEGVYTINASVMNVRLGQPFSEFAIYVNNSNSSNDTKLCDVSLSASNFAVSANGNTSSVTVTATSSTWYNIQMVIDQNQHICSGSFNNATSTAWVGTSTTIPISNVWIEGDSQSTYDSYFDNFALYYSESQTSSSTVTSQCTTCTRVISRSPDIDETVPTTTNGIPLIVEYYVSEDDFCSNLFCQTNISIATQGATNNEKFVYAEEVSAQGTGDISHFFTQINSSGTYIFEIKIFNNYPLIPTNDKLWEITKFHIGAPTSSSTLATYASSTRASGYQTVTTIEEGSEEAGTADSPGVIALGVQGIFNDFASLPPWGYIWVFNQTLQNGTTTAISDIVVSFPTSSPAHGTTLTLPLSSGVLNSIDFINNEGFTSQYGNTFETITYWWEFFWYILFAFWVIKETAGLVSFGSSTPDRGQGRINTVDMRSTNRYGTRDINMRK